MTRTYRRSAGILTLVVLCAAPAAAQAIKAETWNVQFPTSASGRAQEQFLSGLTALHLFMYEDAVEHFRAAQREVPGFALAYWGEALAQYRPIWSIYSRDEARAILNRLAPTPDTRAARAQTAREKAYLAAVEVLFADGPQRERQIAYAAEMRRVADRYPDDVEALALLCVARVMIYSRETNGRERMETVAMALEILERNPLHPGAPRYLIQSADDPEHAALGLAGVRAIERWTEEGGAESIHIPSHVYVQFGMWDDAERVNARAFDVSMAWTKAHGLGLADLNMHNYEHLLRWRQFSLLQLGRDAEAKSLIDRAAADFRASGKATPIGTALYRLRAQFMIETGRWDLVMDLARDAAADGYDSNPFVLQAIGLGAARTGQLALAREVAARLQATRAWRSQAEHHQVLGLVALAEGDRAGALRHLADAVAIDERNIDSHGLGVPDPSKPVWELYGEVLLGNGQPKEALAQFERALEIYRRRPASLLGAARASLALGDRQKAEQHLAELRTVWQRADAQHPGMREVRRVQSAASDPFEPDRLMADVRAYYDFGVHRTAHEGDVKTSDWLAERFRAIGLETSEHRWSLRQFFLDEASIEDAQGRFPAFPLWLPRATGPDGVRARLVLADPSTPPADLKGQVAWLQVGEGTGATRQALERRAVEAGAVAIVFETNDRAGTGEFVAQNAERRYVDAERPVPTLTFGAAHTERLRQSVGREVSVRTTGRMDAAASARNIVGRVTRNPDGDWIVVSTPSSGWFTCAGERGPGIAMLLALAEWAASRSDGLNYLFVGTSGHELDFLGARLFHEAHIAPPPEKTRAWLHLGASIATPPWETVDGVLRPAADVTTGTLQASEELASIMRDAFAHLPAYRLRTDTRIGEFRDLTEHGYRGLGVVGGSNPWFHVARDAPDSVAPTTLSAVTRAAARTLEGVERFQTGSTANPAR